MHNVYSLHIFIAILLHVSASHSSFHHHHHQGEPTCPLLKTICCYVALTAVSLTSTLQIIKGTTVHILESQYLPSS